MLPRVVVAAYIGPLCYHGYGDCQLWRMVVFIPLADSFDKCSHKHAQNHAEYQEKDNTKQVKPKSEHCTPPLSSEDMVYFTISCIENQPSIFRRVR